MSYLNRTDRIMLKACMKANMTGRLNTLHANKTDRTFRTYFKEPYTKTGVECY